VNLVVRAGALFKAMESPSTSFSEVFAVSAVALKNLGKESTQDASKYAESLKRYSRASAVLGGLALWAIVVAFILMIQFAVKNASLL
jgi:hypothetical protein